VRSTLDDDYINGDFRLTTFLQNRDTIASVTDVKYELLDKSGNIIAAETQQISLNAGQERDLVFDKINPGGIILADNTLWNGKVLETPLPSDTQTLGILKFNEKIKQDKRIEKVILPLRDGLTIIYKLKIES
jgi:hypothetical protein